MLGTQVTTDNIRNETIDKLLNDGNVMQNTAIPQLLQRLENDRKGIEAVESKVKQLQEQAKDANQELTSEINDIEEECNNYKQNIERVLNIKSQLEDWKKNVSNKINDEINDIWDEGNKKFRKDTRWWFQFWSDKPKVSELEQKKNTLITQKNNIDTLCDGDLSKIVFISEEMKKKYNVIESSLKKIKDELEKKNAEHQNEKEGHNKTGEGLVVDGEGQQTNEDENIFFNENKNEKLLEKQKKSSDINKISEDEIVKISYWLKNEQQATRVNYEDIIKYCREFGVNNCDDFKTAFLQQVELAKMQEFIENEKNITLSLEDCKKLMQKLGIDSVEELREKMNNGAQEMAETIYGANNNNIGDKLRNDANNIADYVDCVNQLADNNEEPLIKKNDINALQMQVNDLKATKDGKNIFIQILMFFGYDPDGLVTAYNIAKNRLKEAKKRERDNILTNSNSNVLINNDMYNDMYSGNINAVNNRASSFGSQSLQQANNNILPYL